MEERRFHLLYLAAATLIAANLGLLFLGIPAAVRLGIALLALALMLVGFRRYRNEQG
jgi:hypothetical protein